ncbi:anticodon-binding protein [Nonomuraea sp. NN258]|uniref:anticodon-binding protein n=1 Tax=Nonomuraea antri TaxID=2730852 RepID=UPI00156A6FED|nr:anticodon-binding protein [Nonomuraea antri]NRQ38226.1 anticodon-binding protein [Nonomuraea antri]
MTVRKLADALGEPPVPDGDWAERAVFTSTAALRGRLDPHDLAERVRRIPGVAGVEVTGPGFLRIAVSVPGDVIDRLEPVEIPPPGWPDFPRTWENPGFVVRYGHARACWVERWAGELGVPVSGFRPELLDDPWDRRVLRVLAELPGRSISRDPSWETYLLRLALAYHDAFERAPAVPRGDETATALHTARVRLARAVAGVLHGPERL